MSLTRDQVMEKVRTHLAEELGVDPDSIVHATRFRDDLDADSLDLQELIMELHDTYGVEISEQDAAGIETVGQAVDFALEHLPAAETT